MNKKTIEGVIRTSTISQFANINPDFTNIEEVYLNNLLLWFIDNGDNVETKDGKGIKIHNNTVLNPENIVVLKTKKGFKINENDFIKSDLEYLENLDVNLLTFSEKKQFEFYRNYLNKKNTEPQPKENNKPDLVQTTEKPFKDFFNSDINIDIVSHIQNEFKEYKGKKMAFLIYLLHREFKIISYSLNSKIESRKHFISALKGKSFRTSGIDKHFDEVKINIYQFEKDNDYITIKEKLSKTIK